MLHFHCLANGIVKAGLRLEWNSDRNYTQNSAKGMLDLVNLDCFASSRRECFHCSAMRTSIKERMSWHKMQQIEHTSGVCLIW